MVVFRIEKTRDYTAIANYHLYNITLFKNSVNSEE